MSTPHDAEWLEYDDDTRPVTERPADTIREALRLADLLRVIADELELGDYRVPTSIRTIREAAAALTELEQQLVANAAIANWEVVARAERHRAEAAEADRDLHKSERDKNREWAERAEADRDRWKKVYDNAVRGAQETAADRDRLADTLRAIVNHLGPDHFGGELEGLVAEGNEALRLARAALARHTTP